MANVRHLAVDFTGIGQTPSQDYQLTRDEAGTLQVHTTDPSSFLVRLEGRLTADAPWFEITTVTNLDLAINNTGFKTFKMAPQMRVNIVTNATGTVNAWLME